jgi:putative peptidoglycan lipid II flippase
MDVYLIAISFPTFLSGIFSAAIGFSLVPTLTLYKNNLASYRHFSGLLLIILFILSFVVACVGFVTVPVQIGMLGEHLATPARQDVIIISRITWITTGVVIVVAYLNGMHNAAGRFIWPLFTSLIPFICMIIAGLGFAPAYGPIAVAFGQLAGFILTIFMLLIHTFSEFDFSTKSLMLWKDVSEYLFRTPLIVMAMLCFTVFQLSDAYWAPQIGTGSLAYLGYSQRILVVLGNIVIAGPALVILPRLSEAYADGRIKDLLNDTYRALRMLIIFSLPVALSASILATPLVQLLFERGAFDKQATEGVAKILPIMIIGLMAMLCVVIVIRALFAKHDIARASLLGILITLCYFVLSGLLSKILGVLGIALAYAISWWLALLLSALFLWRGYMSIIFCRQSLVFAAQLAFLAMVTFVVLVAGRLWMASVDLGDGMLIFQMCFVAIAVAAVYLTISIRVLGIEDIRLFYDLLLSTAKKFRIKNSSAL